MIILRKANQKDISEFYKNIHRDFVRKYSEKNEKEEWTSHKRAYKFLINSPNYLLYILEDHNGKFCGQLKFELEGEIAIISIYLVNKFRGHGYARKIIENSIEELLHESDEVEILLAYILEENEASVRVFEKCGFTFEREEDFGGLEHNLYIKRLRG